jgi:16S rRNA G966 N2-methylase RsmD
MTDELVPLRNLRDGREALERARSLGEVRELKRIGDLATAAKRFAEAQGLSEDAKRFASEMELDAKRYLGEALNKQPKNRGAEGIGKAPSAVQRLDGTSEVVPPPTLKELGITRNQSSEAQKLSEIPEDVYQQFKASARSDTLNTQRALRVAREKEAEHRRNDPAAEIITLPSNIDIREGNLRTALNDITGQADAIITDPPYPGEFIEEFDALGELASRILKPDGILAAMVGQTHLPAYIDRLNRWLTYRWCGAYLTDGPATRIHGRSVGTKWKPILIYGGKRFITQDVFASVADDKRHHHWGQSESGLADLVTRLTEPGDLVVDPFLGGGTTAIVCRDLGRRFVGCDIDATAIQTARERLAA